MATFGSALLNGKARGLSIVAKKLGAKGFTRSRLPKGTLGNPKVLVKNSATAPQNSTAADNPGRKGTLVIHNNASGVYQGVYICNAWTSSSSFTFAQLV